MGVRTSRFEAPVTNTPKSAVVRLEAVEPVAGLNVARPASNLSPGETPASQNWVLRDRYIQPRSGLSQYATSGLTYAAVPTMVAVAERVDRSQFLYTQYTSSATSAWASSAVIYDSAHSYANNILAYTNWLSGAPQYVSVGFDATSASAITDIYSLASYARYAAAFDNRLMFFHTATASSSSITGVYPSRLMWSARGIPLNFTDGGYQDVVAMQGGGTAIIAEADRAVLLTEHEVWVARPRLDDFAFDIFNLEKSKGLPNAYERTAANTEAGTIWLGAGPQPYRLVNNQVRALGDKVRDLLVRNLRETSVLWALQSPDEHLYALFYSDSSGSYAQNALFLRTDTITAVSADRDDGCWFQQTFPFGIANGAVLNGTMVLVSSAGTQYRLLSGQTNDAGTAIDARWRSVMLRGPDIFPLEAINDLWIEYRNDDASSATASLGVWTSTDDGLTFQSEATVTLGTSVDAAHAPVTPRAARQPMYEIRLADGSQPRIARLQASLRGYTGRLEGGQG